MRNLQSLVFILLMAIPWACGDANKDSMTEASEESKDDMAQFVEDPEFKDKHQTPGAISFEGKGEMITFPTADGKEGSAYALNTSAETEDVLFVIHEWWGLNDHIKAEAEALAESLGNVRVFALDLYDGKVTDDPDKAGEFMQSVDPSRAEAIVRGALDKVGPEADISTIGWCFGGGWSLRTSILAGDQGEACVMYYGMPVQKADELAPLEADILAIFAEKDAWITPEVASNFQDLAKATGKDLTVKSYDADHAFANPSNPNYDKEAAAQANAGAVRFLKEKM